MNTSMIARMTPRERAELDAEWRAQAVNPPTDPDLLCPICKSFRRDWIDWLTTDGKATGEYNYRCVDCGHEWDRCGDDS